MSSLLSQAMLFERYGPRLSMAQLAKVLGTTRGYIYNEVSADRFPIVTYIDAKKRYADFRDVADHLDRLREKAHGERNET